MKEPVDGLAHNLLRHQFPFFARALTFFSPTTRQGLELLHLFWHGIDQALSQARTTNEIKSQIMFLQQALHAPSFDKNGAEELKYASADFPSLHVAIDAWHTLEQRFDVPRANAFEMIHGFELKLGGHRPVTAEDLLSYCYHTSGVWGLTATLVLDLPQLIEAQQVAVDTATALELTTIAQHLHEDFHYGRMLIPESWMKDAHPTYFSDAWAVPAARRMILAAESLTDASRTQLESLPFRVQFLVGLARSWNRARGKKVIGQKLRPDSDVQFSRWQLLDLITSELIYRTTILLGQKLSRTESVAATSSPHSIGTMIRDQRRRLSENERSYQFRTGPPSFG